MLFPLPAFVPTLLKIEYVRECFSDSFLKLLSLFGGHAAELFGEMGTLRGNFRVCVCAFITGERWALRCALEHQDHAHRLQHFAGL